MGCCPRWRVCWGVAAALLMIGFAQTARADEASLVEARRAVDTSDYMAARTALAAALNKGDANPGELAEIFRLSGIVEAALDDVAASSAAFAKWLSLEPRSVLPAGTSPKIMRPFKTASDQAKKARPLEVKAETSADPPTVSLVIVNDPQKLVVRARVIVRVDGKPEQTFTGLDQIALPHGKRLDLRIQALDQHGNRIVELGTAEVPIVITGTGAIERPKPIAERRSSEPDQPRPRYLQWKLWGAAAGVTALGTGIVGLLLRSDLQELGHLNANSLDHQWNDAQQVESSARHKVLLVDIGLGLTGAFAVGAAVLYFTRPHLETIVAPMPTAGGGGIVLGGHF